MNIHEQDDVIVQYIIDTTAKSAYRWGIAAIITWLIPIVGLPVAIVGIVKSGNAFGSVKYAAKAKLAKTLSWAGLWLSVANAFLGILIHR